MSILGGRAGHREFKFGNLIKGVVILVIVYLVLGVFLTGGIGYSNGQWYNTVSFEFGKSFDALTFFISLGLAVVAWVIYTYIFTLNSINTRKQYFTLIAIGLVLLVAYLVYTNVGSIIPAFKGSLIDNTVQSFIK